MANRSYLCVSDVDTLYPNICDPDYQVKEQTVAFEAYCVPMLWLALFRPGDLRSQMFEIDNEAFSSTAPITKKAAALDNLTEAIPVLNSLFEAEGSLEDYAEYLSQALNSAPGRYVTIELDEIACLWDPDEDAFTHELTLALKFLQTQRGPKAARKRFTAIAQLKAGVPFPPARCYLDEQQISSDQCWNHGHLIGSGWERPVPWELPHPE